MTACRLMRSKKGSRHSWGQTPSPLLWLSIFHWRRERGEVYAFLSIFAYYEYNKYIKFHVRGLHCTDSTPFAATVPELGGSLFVVDVELAWPR